MKNIIIATIQDDTPFQEKYLVKDIESCGDMTSETVTEISNILRVPPNQVKYYLVRYANQPIYKSIGIKTPLHIWSIPIDELPGQLKHITETFNEAFKLVGDGDYRICMNYLDLALGLIGAIRSQLFILHKEYQEFWVRNLLPEISILMICFNELTKDHPNIKGHNPDVTVPYLLSSLINLSITFPGYYFSEDMSLCPLDNDDRYCDPFEETRDFNNISNYEDIYCKIQ